jgi:hypothetical protein
MKLLESYEIFSKASCDVWYTHFQKASEKSLVVFLRLDTTEAGPVDGTDDSSKVFYNR